MWSMQLERLFFSLCWCKHIVIVLSIYKHGFGAIVKAIQTNWRINLVWEYKQDMPKIMLSNKHELE